MIKIDPEKIREVIGSGGKNIQDLIEKCNQVKIDIEQDGRVFIMHAELEWIDKAIELIENICREPELNAIYPAKVIKVLEIGAVVEIWPGCEGLVHISNLAWRRVAKVEDEVKEGDEIVVKLIEVGQGGKLRFSRKDTMPKPEKVEDEKRQRKPREKKEEKVEETSDNKEE
jgi:polyribonucleotide nucleotidyltransferase